MKAVLASTNASFMGMESDATVPRGKPVATGFEDDAFVSLYAHRKLESEIGFDILALVDGELQNVPEQEVDIVTPEWRKTAVFLLRKRSDDGWPKRPRYLGYAVLPEDVVDARVDIERHKCS